MMQEAQIFTGFCLTLVIMQNFFMSIAFQAHKKMYTLPLLPALFIINGVVVYAAYVIGLQLLTLMPYEAVRLCSLAAVAVVQLVLWSLVGYGDAWFSIGMAQLLAALCTYVGYDFFIMMTR